MGVGGVWKRRKISKREGHGRKMQNADSCHLLSIKIQEPKRLLASEISKLIGERKFTPRITGLLVVIYSGDVKGHEMLSCKLSKVASKMSKAGCKVF